MENLDNLFAALLTELDRQGARDNTLVCFTSDHGEMLGDHGDSGKTMPWQGSVSVPFVCSGPGVRQGQVVHRPVATMDLAATFIDYGQAKQPDGMSSQTLRPLLEDALTNSDSYRSFVSSGLQSYDHFAAFHQGFAWRLVVEAATGFKFVCCKGKCPGAPSTAPKVDKLTGFQEILFNTTADPFDMQPLNHLTADMARLRKLLPVSFECGQEGALTPEELSAVLSEQELAPADVCEVADQRCVATDVAPDWSKRAVVV
jgi:arylsulfatase A-like enzyme